MTLPVHTASVFGYLLLVMDASDTAGADREEALAERERALTERERAASERERAVAERERAVAEREHSVTERGAPELGAEAGTSGDGQVARRAAVVEQSETLRRQLVSSALRLAATEDACGRIHEELAKAQPDKAEEYRRIATSAREGARRFRELATELDQRPPTEVS
jgi:colicin import membrane protein